MSVAEMERRFYELKGKLDVGAIGEEEFKAEIEKLRFQDEQNRWWMIGAQSGKWYNYDGMRWIPGQPPVESTTPVPAEEPRPAIQPIQPGAAAPVPAPPVPATPTPTVETHVPVPVSSRRVSVAATPENLRPAPRSFQLPVRGPILIGCAALLAIFLVLVFWVAVENLVPGKPISTAFGTLTGGKSTATATPTRAVGQPVAATSGASPLIAEGDRFVLESQFDTAIAQYQAAAQMSSSSAVPLTRWSRALAFRGHVQDALAKAQQAIQRAPADAEAQAQLARVLAWNGQVAEAMTVGEKAVQLDPKSSNAHAYLAEIYLLAKRAPDAQTQAQLALQLAPSSAEAHRAQAWVLTVARQKEPALAEWRQTVALEPNLFFRHFELGEVFRVYFGDPMNAVSEYQKATALYGAYFPAYNRLGLAYLGANLSQRAIPEFQHAITLDPNNADNYAYLGIAFGQSDQCSQAIPYFEQALKINPDNAVATKALGECQSGKAPSAPAAPAPTTPLTPPSIAASPG
ncbi:MAG: tetratricopeptide repeat protein [Chloroflexi bacterium]|nr:tetratricopeptide repeat protein [Chloroflexota bacterium]